MIAALIGLAGAVAVVGIGLAGLIMNGQHRTDDAIAELGAAMSKLREPVGCLEGLRDALPATVPLDRHAAPPGRDRTVYRFSSSVSSAGGCGAV